MGSEVFSVEDLIALSKDLVSLSAQVKLLTDVAHIKQLLAVFLQQQGSHIEISGWNGHQNWPPHHPFGDKYSPAQQYIAHQCGITKSLQYYVIVIFPESNLMKYLLQI